MGSISNTTDLCVLLLALCFHTLVSLWLVLGLLIHFQGTQYNMKTRQLLVLPLKERVRKDSKI